MLGLVGCNLRIVLAVLQQPLNTAKAAWYKPLPSLSLRCVPVLLGKGQQVAAPLPWCVSLCPFSGRPFPHKPSRQVDRQPRHSLVALVALLSLIISVSHVSAAGTPTLARAAASSAAAAGTAAVAACQGLHCDWQPS
jgi:hypothetical protein